MARRAVKREVGSTSCSGRAEPGQSDDQTNRRVLRSRYLAVKTIINGMFLWFASISLPLFNCYLCLIA